MWRVNEIQEDGRVFYRVYDDENPNVGTGEFDDCKHAIAIRDQLNRLMGFSNDPGSMPPLPPFSWWFDLVLTETLAAIAVVVFSGLTANKNMWLYITLYWLVLSAKNIGLFITKARSWRNRKEQSWK